MLVVETAIAFVLMLGALVMFHELGHFISARMVGIRVDEFAFGFGPKLIKLFRLGDTEYTIHPVPLGGFVKLAGMEPGQEDVPDGFQAQSIWKRMFVIFSGPFASFVLAVAVFLLVGIYWGFPDPTNRTINRVAQVNPKTVASRIGLRAGDRILAIDGQRITEGGRMTDIIHSQPGVKLDLLVARNGRRFHLRAAPSWSIDYLGAVWSFMEPTQGVAGEVPETSAAGVAGIQKGDKLLRINGERIRSGEQMLTAIKSNGDQKARIELLRNDSTITVSAKPSVEWVKFAGAKWLFPGGYAFFEGKQRSADGIRMFDQIKTLAGKRVASGREMVQALRNAKSQDVQLLLERQDVKKPIGLTEARPAAPEYGLYSSQGLFGFLPAPLLVKSGFSESIRIGLERTEGLVLAVLTALQPKNISENVGGPVLIAKQTSSMVALGAYYVIHMAGMLSLSLAIINLFPIPVLDGGHLAILLVEAVRRKRLTPEQMQTVQMVGLAILGMIIIAVLFSDVSKLIGGNVPQ